MNVVTDYLKSRWASLRLTEFGNPDSLACVFVTPRFRTSSHILIFILSEGRQAPVLVAKVPRLPGDHCQLDREAKNLRCAQALCEAGYSSIPRVVAFDDIAGHRSLIETVVNGKPLRPDSLRSHLHETIGSSLAWLIEFQQASAHSSSKAEDWQTRLIDEPLAVLDGVFPAGGDERSRIELIRVAVEPLRSAEFPLVFEHGDFCGPNILRDHDGRIGVVDWELAENSGLPAADVFFFLNSAAFASRRARSNAQYLAAFREAFYGPDAWAREYLVRYCTAIGLDRSLLQPLFLLTWSRYVANLVTRLRPDPETHLKLGDRTIGWLRDNRYYQLWKYASSSKDGIFGF